MKPIENFEELDFFWKNCSRETAESVLQNCSDGTFLLRNSSDDFPCLSFKHETVIHDKIMNRLDGSIMIGQDNLFPSKRYLLEEIKNLQIRLRFFDANSSQSLLHLHTGLKCSNFQDLSSYVTLYPDNQPRKASIPQMSFSQKMEKLQTSLFGKKKWQQVEVELTAGNLTISSKSKKEEITNKQINQIEIMEEYESKKCVLKLESFKKTVFLTAESAKLVTKLHAALKSSIF